MFEALALAGTFAAGAVVGHCTPWGRLKQLASRAVRKPKTDEINEEELAQELLRDVRQHVVTETMRLRDMAHSDDPAIEEAMRGIARSFLITNKEVFK